MALGPADNIMPPRHEQPLAEQGNFSHAWDRHNQDVADRLNGMHRGVVDGSEAKAGDVGEYLTAHDGPFGLASNVPASVVAMSLQAGDWDVSGIVTFTPAASTHPLAFGAGVSQAPGGLTAEHMLIAATFATGTECTIPAPVGRFSLSAGATVYLVALSVFTSGGMNASGTIKARRAR